MSDEFMAGLIIGAGLLLMLLWSQKNSGDESWRYQINEHGCGHFYLDENQDRQWNWIQCNPTK